MGGRGHEFETRHPLHFGCVLSLRCRATWCWRRGMCATQGLSHVQRDTTSDGMLAFGHSRSGSPSPSSISRQSICRRRHHHTGRVRLDGRGHHSFKVDTRVRIPHATPAQGTLVELTLRGGNRPQRLGGAGTRDRMDTSLVNSVARVPACLAGSRGFDSRTRRQICLPR